MVDLVRINILNPSALSDQHLIAEYNEILMLIGYVKLYPKLGEIPDRYCLGNGHIRFFKDKLAYIKDRHELIKTEMNKRGFKTNKQVELDKFHKGLLNNWTSSEEDRQIIKKRLVEKINAKPNYYRYYSDQKPQEFFINLLYKDI